MPPLRPNVVWQDDGQEAVQGDQQGGLKIRKKSNIYLNQMGSNGIHKNKTYLSKEKNSKVHIHIGKCIYGYGAMSNKVQKCNKCAHFDAFLLIAP